MQRVMAVYSELELRYARPVAEAMLENPAFRRWLLSETPYEYAYSDAVPLGEEQASLRSRGLKNPYWFNYWCGKDVQCKCRIGTGIETDVLIILVSPQARRLAIHVEVKRPGEKLGDGQAESYRRRAACWASAGTRPRTVAPHEEFLTVLLAGRSLAADPRIGLFDKVLFHDEIARLIHSFPEPGPAI